jgi:hypothetical protein
LVLSLLSCSAAADGPSMADDIRWYYGGEARAAYLVTALSVLSVAAGAICVTRSQDFARGLGWPLLGIGAVEGIGAISYAFTVQREIDHYEALLAKDPTAFRAEELAHIQGTTSRFVYYRATELGLTLAGIATAAYGFAANRDVWKGIGIGVAAEALPFFIIDTFNNARAGQYADRLDKFDPTRLHVGRAGDAWTLSYVQAF